MEEFNRSRELHKKSRDILVGGVNSPARAYEPFPISMQEGKGSKIYDLDGNEFIDYSLAFGPLILGHKHPGIKERVEKQLEKGWAFGTSTEIEARFGEELVGRFESIDKVRLVNTGTEATMSAIRLARGYTGRGKILKFNGGFHGAHESVLIQAGSGASTHGTPDSSGVPKDFAKSTIVVPWNDKEAVEEVFKKEGESIACVIAEPILGNTGCIPPEKDFLGFLGDVTEEYASLLLFDEVITGFRVSPGGAQEFFDISPDLTTLGKIAGGGFPIGILGGRKDIMDRLSPEGPVYQAGTFSGNPITVAAGLESLKILEEENVIEKANDKGEKLRNLLEKKLEGFDVKVQGISSIFSIFLTEQEKISNKKDVKECDLDLYDDLHLKLAEKGIYFPASQFEVCFLSYKHADRELKKTVEAVKTSLEELK